VCQNIDEAVLEATSFLMKNMPSWDRMNNATIVDGVIVSTVNMSLSARMNHPWAAAVPREIFNNFVLPYANVNEARTDWRTHISAKLLPFVHNASFVASSSLEAGSIINSVMWSALSVHTGKSITFKSEQTPAIFDPMSTIVFGYASCTGISILYVDALRSIGVPARIAGTPAWNGKVSNGNHNWVEVWSGSEWQFIEGRPAGPGETFSNPCDKWFCNKGKFGSDGSTRVFAPQFEHTDVTYPLAWDLRNKEIPGVDRTDYYMDTCRKC
jgi:hypothetical protein